MRLIKVMLGVAVFLLALPGTAEEIIYFKNGQSLPIRSHVINEGMVRVDLGENSMMEFPEFTIDRIEIAGKDVLIKRSYGAASNQQVPTTQGTFPVQGTRRPDRNPVPMVDNKVSPIKTDPRTGLAGYFRNGGSTARNRNMIQVTGDMRVFGSNPTRRGDGSTFTGTTPMGQRHVLGGLTPVRNPNARNPNIPQKTSVVMKDPRTSSTPAAPSDGSDKR